MLASNEQPAALRIGKVLEFDPKTLRAKVEFPDMDLTSYWLPVIVMNSKLTKDSCFLDKDEHVVCIMQGTGSESGFILGAVYDVKNPPAVQDGNKRTVIFDDGMSIVYDRSSHQLNINCPGEIVMHADNHININAGRIDLN